MWSSCPLRSCYSHDLVVVVVAGLLVYLPSTLGQACAELFLCIVTGNPHDNPKDSHSHKKKRKEKKKRYRGQIACPKSQGQELVKL